MTADARASHAPGEEPPRLSRRIAALDLPPEVRRTFGDELVRFARQTCGVGSAAEAMARRLAGPAVDAPPAALEALWPHAEIFVTACVYVVLTDGRYSEEEARELAALAHRLGLSASRLAAIEARAIEDLRSRGAARLAAGRDG